MCTEPGVRSIVGTSVSMLACRKMCSKRDSNLQSSLGGRRRIHQAIRARMVKYAAHLITCP